MLDEDPFERVLATVSLEYKKTPREIENLGYFETIKMFTYIKKANEEMNKENGEQDI